MNKHSIGIAAVFIIFIVPMLLISSVRKPVKDGNRIPATSEVDLSEVIQVRYAEGSIYALKECGELYCDNELFITLPDDTLDFCVYHSEIYALRPDGLYLSGKRIWDISLNDEIQPTNLLILSSKNPEAYILLSDRSCYSRKVDLTGAEVDIETAKP